MQWLASIGVISALLSLVAARNDRILVLTGDNHGKSEYTKLESYLGGKHGKVRFSPGDKKAPKLFVEGQIAYSHLVLLSTNPPCTILNIRSDSMLRVTDR
jgi:hypothetical protein